MNIVKFIPLGKENAISRASLAQKAGLSDRKMRNEIENARRRGFLIINLQDGRGYYRSDDLDDIERQYRIDTARGRSIWIRRNAMRKMLKEAGREV